MAAGKVGDEPQGYRLHRLAGITSDDGMAMHLRFSNERQYVDTRYAVEGIDGGDAVCTSSPGCQGHRDHVSDIRSQLRENRERSSAADR